MCATTPSSSTLSIEQISVNFSLQLILFQLKFQNLSIDVVSLNKNCKLNVFKLIFFSHIKTQDILSTYSVTFATLVQKHNSTPREEETILELNEWP